MTMPIVAIVGRPNVGKSTLFNRLVGRRQALVHDEPGVTRDRLYGESEWDGVPFLLVDTGGMLMDHGTLASMVTAQSRVAIDEADLVMCVLDSRVGRTPLDEDVVAIVRQSAVPVLYVVNKCDHTEALEDFFQLGVDPLLPISAEHGIGINDLCDAIVQRLGAEAGRSFACAQDDTNLPSATAIAIVGRPNVGKSTLVNTLVGAERVVAHDMPGTTRDVIDVQLERHGEQLVLLDTAGIRRKARTNEAVEVFSIIKALRAMERANVVILLIDAIEGMTHQDRQLAATAVRTRRPVIVALNKWDLWEQEQSKHEERKTKNDYVADIHAVLGEWGRLPVVCVSALHGDGIDQLWRTIRRYAGAARRRLSTSVLNTLVERVQQQHHIPVYQGKPVKIYYATQVGVAPPRFLFFTNHPDGISESYQRFLRRHLEETFGVPGLPMALQFRAKS